MSNKKLDEIHVFTFGKFKGKTVMYVLYTTPDYKERIIENNKPGTEFTQSVRDTAYEQKSERYQLGKSI